MARIYREAKTELQVYGTYEITSWTQSLWYGQYFAIIYENFTDII